MDARLDSIADDFNRLALQYFDLWASPSTDPSAWLAKAEVAVAELYAAGLGLPLTQPSHQDAPDMPPEERSRLMSETLASVGGQGMPYSLIFHPLATNEEPVVGTLADDLASIYEDLYGGVELLAAGGTHEDAIWEWRLNFQIHWSRHALGALQALNDMLR